MDQIVPNGQVLMVAFKLLQKEARPPVVTLGPNSQDVSECPLNVDILAPSVRGRANPTLLKWLHRPALVDTGDLYCFGDP